MSVMHPMKASYKGKKQIINILSKSFNENKSVNYIIKQDRKRASRIAALMDYFIGVDPDHQNKGAGTELLNYIIQESINNQRSVYLETSTDRNFPWYKKMGFEVYKELDLGYRLFFLRKNYG